MTEDDIWGDEPEAPTPASIPHKKPAKRKKQKKAAPAARPNPQNEYAGITSANCPVNCIPKRCVITHTSHCVHPNKGALFSEEQMNPDIVKRWNKARKILAMGATANRFKDDDE